MTDFRSPPGPRRRMFALTLLFFLPAGGASSVFYAVPSNSVAVVQRFGRVLKEVRQGLHFRLPFGIDVTSIVPVKLRLKQDFGFATPGATNPWHGPREPNKETRMVTSDLNTALVKCVVQYRISNPGHFLVKVPEPQETLRAVSASEMREVVGDRNTTLILYATATCLNSW